jgi:hypothetical protein
VSGWATELRRVIFGKPDSNPVKCVFFLDPLRFRLEIAIGCYLGGVWHGGAAGGADTSDRCP